MDKQIPPNISAREMQQRSAKAIKGTPAAHSRAVKAGRYAWSKRIKGAFVAGFEMAAMLSGAQPGSLIGAELAWEIWLARQNKVRHQVPP